MTWLCPGRGCLNQVQRYALCEDCFTYLGFLLERIEVLYYRAFTLLPKSSGSLSERVTGSASVSTAPLRVSVLDTIQMTEATVNTWANIVRVEQGDPWTGGPDMSVDMSTLSEFYRELPATPTLVDLFNTIQRIHKILNGIAGDVPEYQRFPDPCPVCNTVSVIRRRQDDYTRCLTCSGMWGQAAYHALMRTSTTLARTRPSHRSLAPGTETSIVEVEEQPDA